MKTINLTLAIALILFAFNVQAKDKIVIKKNGGGPKGYKNVKELHSGGTHKLNCSEPGYTECKWIEGFTIVTSPQLVAIDQFIEDKIGDKDYSGTGNLAGTTLWFCWMYDTATGTTSYSITEDAPDCNFE
ncbi:MAG: hypothetical protein ACK44D_05840 [Bacteroidia bacterium]